MTDWSDFKCLLQYFMNGEDKKQDDQAQYTNIII